MELKISNQSHLDCEIVAIHGEIDLYTAPHLHNELKSALDAGARRLVIDLSRVGFCDSTGMNVLLSVMRQAREQDGDLELAGPTPAVLKILSVTGLDTVFTVHDSTGDLPAAQTAPSG
ncbi:STAS domain-containing protein [Lipingzhangella sp. LS1_29]|uniref:Anti-sigma factor antagonist n=1 Tax=Lipingzhangella rawalii TaxID=2055835 RepID=A0ABU2H8N5_9ACTN|nr:STAS domain-containing protein [Lipingzhangella rawalii]MDS1271666.1 STAS domain-containing protein [Lipingzhangella rawalii]